MKKTYKYVPFGSFSIGNSLVELMITMPGADGHGYVMAEKPDAEYGFKTVTITYPDLHVTASNGFTVEELQEILGFVKDNIDIVLNRVEAVYA